MLKCTTQICLPLSGRLLEAGKERLNKASVLWDVYLILFSGPLVLLAVVVSTAQGNDCAFVPKIGVSLPQKHSEPCCWERIALESRKKAAKCQRCKWGDREWSTCFIGCTLLKVSQRGLLVAACFFLVLCSTYMKWEVSKKKANPGVAGIAVAVQENHFPHVLSLPHIQRIIN